jgi:hypothetical protein
VIYGSGKGKGKRKRLEGEGGLAARREGLRGWRLLGR